MGNAMSEIVLHKNSINQLWGLTITIDYPKECVFRIFLVIQAKKIQQYGDMNPHISGKLNESSWGGTPSLEISPHLH